MDIRTFFGLHAEIPQNPFQATLNGMGSSTLYGFTDANCCAKDKSSEKVANALLPISYCMLAESRKLPLLLCKANGTPLIPFSESFHGTTWIDTEKACSHMNFVHPPPNDVCMTRDGTCSYYESKAVTYKGKEKTELILRQDCYSFNVLQHILMQNPGKRYDDVTALLADTTLVEHPYMLMLMWRSEGIVSMDLVAFTDVAVLRMIVSAETERSSASIALINRALKEYATTGTMTYKETKKSTVPHQKVSLFPLRNVQELRSREFTFPVRSTEIVLGDVRPDISLWQEIAKSRLIEENQRLIEENQRKDQEIQRLKQKCGEL